MGWKQFIKQAQAASRRYEREQRVARKRSEREAMTRHRVLVAQQKEVARWQKELAKQEAAAEVEEYEHYLAMLLSIHQDCGDTWNWGAVAKAPPPAEPAPDRAKEASARAVANAYIPGFIEKLFGGAKKRRIELESTVAAAIAQDAETHEQRLRDYRLHFGHWELQTKISPGVQAFELESCRSALNYAGSFDELAEFNTKVQLELVTDTLALVSSTIEDREIVPDEELKLTAGGKVTRKPMAATKMWTLYQDHVCSCALRIAREVFAVIPIDRVIVNTRAVRLDASTGHDTPHAILAVQFQRSALEKLNLKAIDPSDSMKNFPHRMKFKKSTGFEVVIEMTPDEQWVSA